MARRKARRHPNRTRSTRARNRKPPLALIGAGALLVASGAYLLWPRATAAGTLPPAPLPSPGSSSISSRTAAGSGSGIPVININVDGSSGTLGTGAGTGTASGDTSGGNDYFAAPPGSSTIFNGLGFGSGSV